MPNPNAWSPDPPSNASIDAPIYWPEGMSPAAVNDSARAMMAAIACLLRDTNGTRGASATGNAYALGLDQSISDLTQPFEVAFFVGSTNSGPATLSVNGTDGKPVLRRHQRQLGPGDLTPGVLYRAAYVPSAGAYFLTSPEIAAPGTIRVQAGPVVDDGWLPCDGRTLSRTAYSALFLAIGGYYGGGDGSTTFQIPDLRGRAPFGVDAGAGRLTSVGGLGGGLGNAGGAETVTLTTAQMPSHSHAGTAESGGATGGGTTGLAGSHNHGGQTQPEGGHTHTATVANDGAHGHTGTTGQAGGEGRGFSLTRGNANINAPGASFAFVADVGSYEAFEEKRSTSTDPGHIHPVSIPNSGAHSHAATISNVSNHVHTIVAADDHFHTLPAAAAHEHPLAIDAAGGGQPHSSIPPGLVVQFVIKT
ncbi:phage tail protein [Methylobacterium nonmethylotrophicum]|uniref:Phage tail collar domain-containing protein n=1 Tax=Methylobacterium nonmethylotrophicum TaxID=1141884 RepID=A0A4Z0NDY8_9HYPH|nr:tail fiber protein [Methylobacterium nonmethylotrophicum]TGD94069.1 hypothetical protein EU555_32640 [Methylobacterium nonmethylotrophicum]